MVSSAIWAPPPNGQQPVGTLKPSRAKVAKGSGRTSELFPNRRQLGGWQGLTHSVHSASMRRSRCCSAAPSRLRLGSVRSPCCASLWSGLATWSQRTRFWMRRGPAFALRRATSPSEVSPALPDRPSIAVLPFQNLSGDPEQDYFADGMVEDIIGALSRIRWLFVIARNSSFTYQGRAVDVKQVGRELGVRYVLEGSLRKAANRVRITGQLIDASTGGHLWAERFEGTLDDIFELQDQISVSIVGTIARQLERAEIERAKR